MRKYTKRNKRYWYGDHYLNWVGYLFLILLGIAIFITLFNRVINKPLVSPVSEGIVSQVYAYSVSCENPRGYLECKVYSGELTWEQHDVISKLIDCESNWNPDAIHVNRNGSVDMGIMQINSIHKDISNADKLNYEKAIDWAIAKIKRDGGYHAWVCARYL
jgi:hypothetical protein